MTRSSRLPSSKRRHWSARNSVIAVMLLAATGAAHALGLGAPEVASYIGQPFQMRVPVLGDDAADLTAECVQVLAERGDLSVPGVAGVRTRVARGATRTVILVTSDRPVNEPAARVVLRAGCGESPVEREFVVLLDPPVLGAPLAAAPVEAPAAIPASVQPPPAPIPAAPAEGRARLEVVPRPTAAPDRLPRATPRSAAESRRVAPVAPGPVSKAPPAAPKRDRLKIVEPDTAPAREIAVAQAPAAASGLPPASGSAAPGVSGPSSSVGTAASGTLSSMAGAGGSAAAPEVQAQLTALASQMNDLRKQLDAMSQRNRELSQAADRGVWGWLAAGVLGLALLLLVWVYAQTRRRELRLLAMESDLEGRMTAVQRAPAAPFGGAPVVAPSALGAGAGAAAAGVLGAGQAAGRGFEAAPVAQPAVLRASEPRTELTVGGHIEVTEIAHPATEHGFPRETPPTQPAPDPNFPRTQPPASAIPRTLDAYAHEAAERRNEGTPLDIDLSAPAHPVKPRIAVLQDPASAAAPTKTGVDFDLDPPTNVRH